LWWPSKSAVVLDVFVADHTQDGDPLPIPDSGDLAADLRSVLVETVAYFTDPANDNLLRAMTAEIQYDEDYIDHLIDHVIGTTNERPSRRRRPTRSRSDGRDGRDR
jgi:hypothetical protein